MSDMKIIKKLLNNKKNLITMLFISLLLSNCIDIMNLPSSPDNTMAPSSAKQYIEKLPRWQFSDIGIDYISDIFIAKDGKFFIADSVNNKIVTLLESGDFADDSYNVLQNININNTNISPTSVCVDPRYIVYFADGNDKIYAWNQFISQTGVSGIIDSMKYTNGTDTIITTPLTKHFFLSPSFTPIANSEYLNTNSTLIDSITSPYIFYDSLSNIDNDNLNYTSQNKKFVSLAPNMNSDNVLFGLFDYIVAMDKLNDKLARIMLMPSELVLLDNGQAIWTYQGVFFNGKINETDVAINGFLAEPGTGDGTVNNPTGMTSDNGGNIYYTQYGNYFGLHKLKSNTFRSAFTLNDDEIMDLDQFQNPIDVAVDDNASIFVLDNSENLVKKFVSGGSFDKYIGVSNNWIRQPDTNITIFPIDTTEIIVGNDTTYNITYDSTTTIKDTLILKYENDVLINPTAIAEYDGVIYISDTGNNRILRYTLSEDVNIQDPDQ